MSDLDEATERIIARATRRNLELKQDENSPASPARQDSFALELEEEKASRRSRYNALAATLDDYGHDELTGNSPILNDKDTFKRGTCPRVDYGETRPSILFSPPEGRRALEELPAPKQKTMPPPLPIVRCAESNKPDEGQITPSFAVPVKTQWRGAVGAPVVVGTDPNEKKLPDVRAANIAKLRNRWEFSASTGTPLHPDKSEAALREEYLKQSQNSVYEKKSVTPRMKRREMNEDGYVTHRNYIKSGTSSPVGKSPRMSYPEMHEEEYSDVPNEESDDEDIDDDHLGEANRIIDAAFDFMEGGANSPKKATSRLSQEWMAERQAHEEEEERRRAQEREEHLERQEKLLKQTTPPKFIAPPPPLAMDDEDDEYEEEVEEEQEQEVMPQDRDEVIGGPSKNVSIRSEEDIRAEEELLQKSIVVQQEQITQASRALAFCRDSQFRGSREEVDAQRALLIASETRRSLLKELEDIRNDVQYKDGPRGAMTISSIIVRLSRDVSGATIGAAPDSPLYYFIVLIRHRAQVHHTALISSEDAYRRKGALEFAQYLRLEHLPPDFSCDVEVWGLRTRREQLAHEDKFKLKGSTLPKKKKGVFSSLLASSSSADPISESNYLPNPSETAFTMLGRLSLDINSIDRRKFVLQDAVYPLEGSIQFKIKRHAMEKGEVLHRGFLSLFQRMQGQGVWMRYWCVLENGEMKFWRAPEDEATKDWIVLIDLSTCASNGVHQEAELSSFPNSFRIDVWVPRDEEEAETAEAEERHHKRKNVDRLRVMIAADSKEELTLWVSILNNTIRNHLMWAAVPKH